MDYSLSFLIYHKINELINSIMNFKIKNYQYLIDQLINLYDKNKLYQLYKVEKNNNTSKRHYLEKEIITYIYNALILIERLGHNLLQGKNEYLQNNYYSEKIYQYENKMDMAKRLFNNKFKRNEEILRRKMINEKTIKKFNKIIFKPIKKVPQIYKMFKKVKKEQVKTKVNEYEDLIYY